MSRLLYDRQDIKPAMLKVTIIVCVGFGGQVGRPKTVTRQHAICTSCHECSGVMMSAALMSAGERLIRSLTLYR